MTGQRAVEELNSDDDSDTHGGGVGLSGNRRFVSDPLHFTGVDLGQKDAVARRGYAQPPSDDASTSEASSDSDDGDSEEEEVPDWEQALVEAAMARIRRAQAKGKEDVRLNKDELKALERHRDRVQRQDERKLRKQKEKRVSIPIAHLEPASRQSSRAGTRRSTLVLSEDQPVPGAFRAATPDRQAYPPMGYFPPPKMARTRPRSGTTSSQRPPSSSHSQQRSERGDSPFNYSYVNAPPPNTRHVSDTAARPHSVFDAIPSEPDFVSHPAAAASAPSIPTARHPDALNPFQFMTSSSPGPYQSGSAASRRHVSGPSGNPGPRMTRSNVAAAARGVRPESSEDNSEEATEEDDDDDRATISDEPDQGARIDERRGVHRPVSRGRERIIVVEDEGSPEREAPVERPRTRSKKPTPGSSPVKRKPVGGGGGGGGGSSSRRRKGR